MRSPFPGMDPFLESPEIWPGLQHCLAVEIATVLNQQATPPYFADPVAKTVKHEIEMEVYTEDGTQETLRFQGHSKLWSVHLYVIATKEPVTSIQILGPYDKRKDQGLSNYRRKRTNLLKSTAHFIEIDLLREGQRPGCQKNESLLDTDYVFTLSRYEVGKQRDIEVVQVALCDPLPKLTVPLHHIHGEVQLDMGAVIHTIYQNMCYGWRIDYQQPVPPPKLRPPMAEWIRQHLPQVGEPA
jgi:hypothetical protein